MAGNVKVSCKWCEESTEAIALHEALEKMQDHVAEAHPDKILDEEKEKRRQQVNRLRDIG